MDVITNHHEYAEALVRARVALKAALTQIREVCDDNKGAACNHAMALAFVRSIAAFALCEADLTPRDD